MSTRANVDRGVGTLRMRRALMSPSNLAFGTMPDHGYDTEEDRININGVASIKGGSDDWGWLKGEVPIPKLHATLACVDLALCELSGLELHGHSIVTPDGDTLVGGLA